MRASLVLAAAGLLAVGQAHSLKRSVAARDITKRVPTPDNTCGNVAAGSNNGYTCDPNLEFGGPCCSQNGYCGTTTAYCGTGCQSGFGTCEDPNNPSVTECGPTGREASCPSGQCCSSEGYCGTGGDFCSDPDCQYKYGTCDSNTTPAGASTLNDPRPLVGSVSYDNEIYDCVKNNVVALTFDDGPGPYTNGLLDVLKQYGFTATFFVTGNNNGKGPIDTTSSWSTVIRRMISEGHQVASHTWSHYSLSEIPSAKRKEQMVKNERAIANIIGQYPTYMRPPFSQCSPESGCPADMKALGYHRIFFDLDTQDYLNPDPSQIQNSKDIVRDYLADRSAADYLSIQHDIVEQSARNLSSYFFDRIQARGWKGVTVGECLNDPKANWYRTPSGIASSSSRSMSTSLKTSSVTRTTSTARPTTTSKPTITSTTNRPVATTTARTTTRPWWWWG